MRIVTIPILLHGVYSTLVHIDYRPSRLVPLPRSICVGSNCMIPHYDIQGHSASVDWYSSGSGGLEISLKALSGAEETWHIPQSANSTNCFILSDRPADEPDDDDDFDYEDLGPASKCMQVTKQINPSPLSTLLTWLASIREEVPAITGWLISELSSPIYQLALLSALLMVSVWIVFSRSRITRQRVSGLVRVSFTDPRRRSEYTMLPSRKFPEASLTQEAIVRELISKPGYSSFTIIRTSLNYSSN